MARSNQNIIRLLSQERLQGYGNNISKHSQNLHLIAKITPKIALLEIVVRNIVDIELSKDSADWILNRTEKSVVQVKKSIDERNKDKELLSHHQYISRFSLGNVMKIIEELQLYPLFFQISKTTIKTTGILALLIIKRLILVRLTRLI